MVSKKLNDGIEQPPSDLHSDDLSYLVEMGLWKDSGQFLTPAIIANRLALDIKNLHQDGPNKIADFGCGPGALTRAVRDEFPDSEIIGYDIDNDALKIFKTRFHSDKRIQSMDRNMLLEPLDEKSIPAIISNPPYLLSRRLGRKMTKKLRATENFPVMSGKLNTFSLFIQAALRALTPGGVAAFVVPIGVANLHDHHPLRELLVKECDMIRITWCIDKTYFAEQGAAVDVLLISFRKRQPDSKGTNMEVLEWDGRKVTFHEQIESGNFSVFPTRALLEAEEQSGTPITEEFEIVARGFNWRKGWKKLKQVDADVWEGELYPIVKGGDIRPDGQLSSELIEINYLMLEEHDFLSRTCDFNLHSSTRPRLLLADITSKIKVTCTTKPILPMNSVKVIFHKEDSENRLHDLMNLLKKESTFKRLKLGQPNLHLTKGNLETLLIPRGDA